MRPFPIRTVALAIAIIGDCGYGEGKHPFRMVQLCLESSSDISAFANFMRKISDERQMQFYNRSRDTSQELPSLAAGNENLPFNDQTLNIGAQLGDDFSLVAGNLGTLTDQFVLDSNTNAIAIGSMVIQHEGFRLDPEIIEPSERRTV